MLLAPTNKYIVNKSIKICLVGGEDAHKRIALSKYLIEDNYNVTILGTKDYEYPDNINYIKYNLNRQLNLLSDLKTILEYRKLFKSNNFDIIQTFDTKPAFLVPIALFGINTKIVRTITGLGKVFVGKNIKSIVARLVYIFLHFIVRKKVNHTTFQNKEDKDIFLKNKLINKSNHSMIYGSGIDLKQINAVAPRKSAPFTVTCISRLIYEKGIINYLEASKICSDKGHNFNFLLIGPLEENSNKLNESIINNYKETATWLGKRSDVQDLLMSSDIFVLPTFYREGFARVLLEASSLGLPMVTTDVPGVRDIARHNKEALIVPVQDSEALAQAIIKLSNDSKLSDKLSDNALLNVKKYSLEVISGNYISIYNKII